MEWKIIGESWKTLTVLGLRLVCISCNFLNSPFSSFFPSHSFIAVMSYCTDNFVGMQLCTTESKRNKNKLTISRKSTFSFQLPAFCFHSSNNSCTRTVGPLQTMQNVAL